MGFEPVVLVDDSLAVDEERLSEMASDFPDTWRRVGEAKLSMEARFVLARGAVERLSAKGEGKVRYRLPLQVSFLPPPAARFAYAQLVLALDAHPDLDILAVRPVEEHGTVEIGVETKLTGEAGLTHDALKLGGSSENKRAYKQLPITIRGIGPGSDTAEWTFDGPAEEGGLPPRVDLGLDLALSGKELQAALRMTAGIRWQGLLGLLPFAWPRGEWRRLLTIELPEA